MARVFVHASDGVIQRWEVPPRMLAALTDQTLAAKGPVLADHARGLEFGGEPCVIAVAAPMPVHGKPAGILVVGLADGVEVAPSDVSILVTLANHAGVALHNASLFQENGRRVGGARAPGLRARGDPAPAGAGGAAPAPQRGAQPDRARAARQRLPAPADDRHEPRVVPAARDRSPPAVLERVLAAQALARSAMDEIREVIFELSSDGQIELPRALREVIEDVEAGTRLEVGLRVYGQTQPVAATTQHALVQIAREALFNVVRHAGARHAWVTLRWRPQVVSLAVADDGSGNHRKLQHQLFISRPDGDHLGLAGIAERVRSVGGATWFERRRGGGVKLRVEVPLGGAVGVA